MDLDRLRWLRDQVVNASEKEVQEFDMDNSDKCAIGIAANRLGLPKSWQGKHYAVFQAEELMENYFGIKLNSLLGEYLFNLGINVTRGTWHIEGVSSKGSAGRDEWVRRAETVLENRYEGAA